MLHALGESGQGGIQVVFGGYCFNGGLHFGISCVEKKNVSPG